MSDPSSSICIGCGLCCDGTLHGRTTVREDDEQAVVACGLTVGEENHKRFFEQPCPRFSCGECSVYQSRPVVCRTYRCELLRAVDAGRTTETEALNRIATAKMLVAAVREVDRDSITPAQRSVLTNRLKGDLKDEDEAVRESSTHALLKAAALEHFLNRWFLKQQEPVG